MLRLSRCASHLTNLAVVCGVALALGCMARPQPFTATTTDHGRTLTVTVTDDTGLIRGVAFLDSSQGADPALGRPQVGKVAGTPDALQLAWMDGGCPSPVQLHVTGQVDRLRVELRRGSALDDPDCGYMAALVRTATLLFKVPVEATSVTGVDIDYG